MIFRPASCDILDLQSKSKQDRDRDIGKPDDNCEDDVVQLRHARSHAHLERGGGGGGGAGNGGGSRIGGAVIRKPEVFDIPLKQKNKSNEDQEEEEDDLPPSPTPEVKTKEIHLEDLDILKKKPGLQVIRILVLKRAVA